MISPIKSSQFHTGSLVDQCIEYMNEFYRKMHPKLSQYAIAQSLSMMYGILPCNFFYVKPIPWLLGLAKNITGDPALPIYKINCRGKLL